MAGPPPHRFKFIELLVVTSIIRIPPTLPIPPYSADRARGIPPRGQTGHPPGERRLPAPVRWPRASHTRPHVESGHEPRPPDLDGANDEALLRARPHRQSLP